MVGKSRGRRRLVFSVRSILVLILAVAGWLGWWTNTSRSQRAALAAIRGFDVSANITYDNDSFDSQSNLFAGIGLKKEIRPWWLPSSLESRLGRDYFHRVTSVAFGEGRSAPGVSRGGEILREVARLRGLEQAALYFEVRDTDIANLASLRSLKRLDLARECPELTDESLRVIGRLANLEALVIHDAPITDAGLAHLAGMTRLKSLSLGKSEAWPDGRRFLFSGEGLAHLVGLPWLSELNISSPALTGEVLKHMGSLAHLKRLRLKGGVFKDDDLRFLAPLTDLESIEILGSKLDGSGLRHLVGLPNVSYVCLEGPNVTDGAVPHLAKLRSLETVMIYGTRVTAEGLTAFQATPLLRQMGLNPAVKGNTKALKLALPNCTILNGGTRL
jgi:hypothetical protein